MARYLFQLLDNMFLLWIYVAGEVIDPTALDGIGGFIATAAWITIISQGGQYVANYLAGKGIGNADRNVIWAIAISVTISALAVSGVWWIQSVNVAASLAFWRLDLRHWPDGRYEASIGKTKRFGFSTVDLANSKLFRD